MSVLLLILGLVLFVMLVVVHELGHFIVARRNGVQAEEFGIFFPPRLWHRKLKNGTDFSINLLPFGGFVRLKGEHDADTTPHSYGAASLGTKVKILLAGVFMNLVAAFVILMALAWLGMPKLIDNQFTIKSDTKVVKNEVLIGDVEQNSPAEKAGLKIQDQLLSIQSSTATQKVTSAATLPNLTKEDAGQSVTITYERTGRTFTTGATLRSSQVVNASLKTNNPKGYLGISPTDYTLQRSTWSAPIVAGGLIGQFTVLTFKGLGTALKGLGSLIAALATNNHLARQTAQAQASDQVTGPIGIFFILKTGGLLGYQFILIIIAVISLTLAIMNVLPIPALDGGKLFVTLVFRAMRKKLTETIENRVYGTGFALLLILIAIVCYVDIRRH